MFYRLLKYENFNIYGRFFPGKNYGGPPVSVDNFCSLISNNDNRIFIVTTNHDLGNKETYQDITDGWNNRGNCKVLYLSDADFNKSNFENIIKKSHLI